MLKFHPDTVEMRMKVSYRITVLTREMKAHA